MVNPKKIKLLKDSKIGGTIIRAGNYVFVNAFDFKRLISSGDAEDVSAVPLSASASDVYPWAKAATKPDYSWGEISGKPTQEIELVNKFKFGYGQFKETILDGGGNPTSTLIWSSAAKILKLFTETYFYTGEDITSIVLKDELTNKIMTTTIDYGFDPPNITKTIT